MKNNDDYLKLKDLENQIEPDEIQENQSSLHDYQWASNIVKKYINQTNTQKFPCYLFQMENGWKVFLEFKFLNEICIFSGQNDTKSKAFQKSMILMAQKIEKHRNTIGLDMGCDYLKPNLFINLDDLQFSQEQLNQINEFYENESFTQQKSQHIQNYENQSQLTTVKSSSQFEKSFKKQFLHKENLPIFQQKNQILQIINQSQVSIIQGEPGCGKSTQVPQFILDNCQNSNVIMTQPRRIACQSIANRIAFERNQKLGDSQVGYQFRDEKILPVKNEQGSLLICTTGTLLQMLRSDISVIYQIKQSNK